MSRSFLPGPTEVAPSVFDAMRRPMIPLFGPEMESLLGGLERPLQRLFRTREPVLIGTCSSTGFMEAAFRSAVERRVLVIVGGYFGERLAAVAEGCGKEVIRVVVPEGRTVEPDHLARFLDGPPVDAVALVHAETSTGALAPLEELARVVRAQRDLLLLVDAVSSIGGSPVETDAWGIDFVFAGTQKALALPPGLALGVASARLMERARRLAGRGWYTDLLKYHEATVTRRPTQTPAISLLYALEHQLRRIDDAGGVEARWRHHQTMLHQVERWVPVHPEVALLAPEGRRAWTVSALRLQAGCSAGEVVAAMRTRGWTIATGLDTLGASVIRIGHMGEATPDDLDALLTDLGDVVAASSAGTGRSSVL